MAENIATFSVAGLDADADADSLVSELEALDGVMGASVDPGGDAEVRYDNDLLAEERILITVEELGYDVEDGDTDVE